MIPRWSDLREGDVLIGEKEVYVALSRDPEEGIRWLVVGTGAVLKMFKYSRQDLDDEIGSNYVVLKRAQTAVGMEIA